MDELASWDRIEVPQGSGRTVYRRGAGTGVLVLHELPGLEPDVVDFANAVVARGHTVWLPVMFGTPGAGSSIANLAGDVWRFCVRREFSIFARGRTSPIVAWLRELAAALRLETGRASIGVVGMCFSGGFALAMLDDLDIVAPVVAEPALPVATLGLPAGRAARGADLGLSAPEARAARCAKTDVLGLRYRGDGMVGSRFTELRSLLGDRFLSVELDGPGHSVLTKDRDAGAVGTVLDFLDERLDGRAPSRGSRETMLERDVADAMAGFAAEAHIDITAVTVFRHPPAIDVEVGHPLDDTQFAGLTRLVRDRFGIAPAVHTRTAPRSGG